jgi:hypothetical protein
MVAQCGIIVIEDTMMKGKRSKSQSRPPEPTVTGQSEVIEPRQAVQQPVEVKPAEVSNMENITVSRKVKKVVYAVTFPDPKVTALSDEQKAIAVQSFFTARVGYLLRQHVVTETDSIQAFVKAADSMLAFAKSFPTYDGDEEKAKNFVLGHLKATVPNFRLEPAKSYTFGLDSIFEPPKPGETVKTEEDSEEDSESEEKSEVETESEEK